MLEGLSAMCRSELPAVRPYVDPAVTSYVGAVNVGPDGQTDEVDCPACKGWPDKAHTCGRTLNPLVLQRGDFALDDYGTPRCRVTCLPPRTSASSHVPSPAVPPRREWCRGPL